MSNEVKTLIKKWDVFRRLSSTYYPRSNSRAEVAVKFMKRLIKGYTGNKDSTGTAKIVPALLQHYNTLLRDINLSSAQLPLGKEVRDAMPLPRNRYKVYK